MERYRLSALMKDVEMGGDIDVVIAADAQRALDAERERLKGQIDYSIQLQQLIESLRRDDTPSPELYHHKIIVEFKRQLATLQAQLRQVEGERDDYRLMYMSLTGETYDNPLSRAHNELSTLRQLVEAKEAENGKAQRDV